MKLGILFLVLGYVLSQFYRSFLAVLTPVLETDIGATAADLAFASGIWFLVFAIMQIPVGWALDRFGPRLTASLMLGVGGGGGGIIFATATSPGSIAIAMGLFGVAGAPVLMAAYYIFTRIYPQALFATLGGAMMGIGTSGNLAGSAPLAYAVELWGWREVMWGLTAAALLIAIAVFMILRDPEKEASETQQSGNLFTILTNRNLLLIFPLMMVNYVPAAGLRGLWAGPYFKDIFGLDAQGIGQATLMMATAMALGAFSYGPMERLIGSKKWVILGGNLAGAALCLLLWAFPETTWLTSAIIFTAIGFFGASFPAMMAHGQLFLPKHLTGRGITMLNLFAIGGVALMQFVTSAMAKSVSLEYAATADFYSGLFLLFGLSLFAGCVIYAFSSEEPSS
ncbi:MAG: MFS family permease [Paracoccaceae bacterium]|jgi:MFS family permease